MKIDVLTLFPEMLRPMLSASILGRAVENGILQVNLVNIRDYTLDKHRRTDDYPFGGGAGMVMFPQPIMDAVAACDPEHRARRIYLSPRGRTLNQKIVEESPSPFITPELRKNMGEKAVAAAKAVNYSGAGTIEFLVDKHRNFYFLEMNTRLQVEHPITEEVLGVDLVKEQIRVANNEPLHIRQEEIVQRGHAIECRICAEDTEAGFMPSPGVIKQLTEPNGIGVRVDSYVYEGYEIPVYYDPMIGKLIVWATTRQYAIERMRRVLHEYKITGLKTNIGYLRRIMDTSDFVQGKYDTSFIEKNAGQLQHPVEEGGTETENIAMIAAYIDYLVNLEENRSGQASDNRPISRWREFGLQKGVLRI